MAVVFETHLVRQKIWSSAAGSLAMQHRKLSGLASLMTGTVIRKHPRVNR